MAETSTALEPARVTRTPDLITSRDEFNSALQFWRESQFNVLSPFTNISGLAPQHALIASVVKINGDPESLAGDVYGNPPGKKTLAWLKGEKGTDTEEVALSKTALRKLAECGGISTTTLRTDDRRIQNYWEFKCVASYRGVDGGIVVREGSAEWDLREGSERLKGWTSNQITEGRKNGLRNAETRAINAAIRECGTGLKQKYTRGELARPFVVLRVMFQPDMSDSDTRRIVTERALAGTAQLYPAAAPLALPEPDPFKGLLAARQAETSPFPEGYGLIRSLKTEEKKRRDGSGTFLKWTAVDYAGQEHNTIKASIGQALERFYKAKTPVQIVSEDDGYGGQGILEVAGYDAKQGGLPEMEAL